MPSSLRFCIRFYNGCATLVLHIGIMGTAKVCCLLYIRTTTNKKEGYISDLQEYTVIEIHVAINCHIYLQVNVIVS